MFNILDFIDSTDIREYNRRIGTKFTPIEQAVLVYHSDCHTVEEKLSVWHELLATYNEEDFSAIDLPDEGEKINRYIMDNHTYRQVVENTVSYFEKALLLKEPTENVFYETVIYAAHNSHDREENCFSTYEKAYNYICGCQNRKFLDYGANHGLKMKADIRVIPRDNSDISNVTEFMFDSSFRMINIDPNTDGNGLGLDWVFVYVPLPFKKGDIVRTIDDEKYYAIVRKTPDKDYFIHAFDSSGMHITAPCLGEHDGELIEDFDHFYTLGLERCSEEDLPEDSCFFNRQLFLNLRKNL